jgi:phosphomannomutase
LGSDIRFGTDGWRAIIADTFTFKNVGTVARAIAEHVKKDRSSSSTKGPPSLIVGYDNRFLGREFADHVAREFMSSDVRCIVSDRPVPTPTTAYAIKEFNSDGAVMLTASHNPYYYGGIKFIPHYAGPATEEITKKIEQHISDVKGGPESGSKNRTIDAQDITRGYKEHIRSMIDTGMIRGSGLRIACDPLYGAGADIMEELLKDTGCDYLMIHKNKDVLFGGGLPDPSQERLKELQENVVRDKRDVGLGLDGDADRIGIIADDGGYLGANQVIALLLLHLIKNRGLKGAVVRTVATTHLLDAVCRKYGLELIETPVGFKHVGHMMLEREVIIGGEESGGMSIGGHIPEKDGILADLLVCEMIAVEKKPLSKLMDAVYGEFGDYLNMRLDIECPEETKRGLFEELNTKPPAMLAGREVKSVSYKDGVKMVLDDGSWILIRPSGTEPLVRIYLETSTDKGLYDLKKGAKELLHVP